MMARLSLRYVLLLCPFLLASAQAQEWFRFGAMLNYEKGRLLTPTGQQLGSDWCGCEPGGSPISTTGSALGIITAPDLLAPSFSVMARLGVAITSGDFVSSPYTGITPLNPYIYLPPGTVVPPGTHFDAAAPSTNQFSVSSASTDLLFGLSGQYSPQALPAFAFGLGLQLLWRFEGEFTQREWIVDPWWHTFIPEGRERWIDGASELSRSTIRTGIIADISYQIPVSDAIVLLPMFYGQLDLNAAGHVGLINGLRAGAGIGLLTSKPADHKIQTSAMPPLISLSVVKPQPLAATLTMHGGLDSSGHPLSHLFLRSYIVYYHQSIPVIPAIYFEKSTANISRHYQQLSRREDFSTTSLIGLNPQELYFQTLNIIGQRMQSNPSASLSLVGSYGDGEDSSLGTMRAESVRNYLITIWGVDPARLRIGKAIMELRSTDTTLPAVRIVSTQPDIIAPVRTEWKERRYHEPQLVVQPGFSGGKGVRGWEITVRQNGHVVGWYSSTTADRNKGLDIGLIDRGDGSAPAPMIAELLVTDSAGTTAVAHAQVPITFDATEEGADPIRINRWMVDGDVNHSPYKALEQELKTLGADDSLSINIREDTSGRVLEKVEHLARQFQNAGRSITLHRIPPAVSHSTDSLYVLPLASMADVTVQRICKICRSRFTPPEQLPRE